MIDWDEIPEHINYIAMDANQEQHGYHQRPTLDDEFCEWGAGHHVTRFNTPPFDIDIPWRASLHQRPGTWDGRLRQYDSVLLDDGKFGYLDITCSPKGIWDVILEDGTPWLLFKKEHVVAVNRTSAGNVAKRKTVTGLPAEVHNDQPIDAEKALAVIHDLCRGYSL